jgi:hypothetical protein
MHPLGVLCELRHIADFCGILLAQQRQQVLAVVRDESCQEALPTLVKSFS